MFSVKKTSIFKDAGEKMDAAKNGGWQAAARLSLVFCSQVIYLYKQQKL
jgi:hypothetical protein